MRPRGISPIERITAGGMKTRDAVYPLDVIVFATGFDAISGPLTRMDIRAENQHSLKDRWVDGPRSYLGIQIAGFPNFLSPTLHSVTCRAASRWWSIGFSTASAT
jgi:cation diffusion facilitator CzcD-associated flavoprotein CzcO